MLEQKINSTINLEFSPQQREVIEQLKKDRCLVGNTESIIKKLAEETGEPVSDSTRKSLAIVPAFGAGNPDSPTIFVNTDLIREDQIEPMREHEAVELFLREQPGENLQRYTEIIKNLGLEVILESATFDGPEHFIAMYHELKKAFEIGQLDGYIEYRKNFTERAINTLKEYYEEDLRVDDPWMTKEEIEKDAAEKYARLATKYLLQQLAVDIISNHLRSK